MFAGKRYWLVGASEGLGREVAKALVAEGAEVILSARNAKRLAELSKELGESTEAVAVDVADADAVAEAVSKVGRVDGMIYAAGVYTPMAAGEWEPKAVDAMIDVNFAGAARVLGHVVPDFLKRDAGHIVMIGSLSGFRGLPGAIGYGASKAGMMHLTENLQADLARTGVKVQLINPGFIKTRLTDKNDFHMPFIMSAEDAAKHVMKAMKSGRFQSNFPRPFSWLFRGSNFLPAPVYYWLFGAKSPKRPQEQGERSLGPAE